MPHRVFLQTDVLKIIAVTMIIMGDLKSSPKSFVMANIILILSIQLKIGEHFWD